ncbi:MAG: chromosome segregation ATPase [Synechococcales bacterium]|nr:chromosome segregation ATPase [Synechococcales bacterium]
MPKDRGVPKGRSGFPQRRYPRPHPNAGRGQSPSYPPVDGHSAAFHPRVPLPGDTTSAELPWSAEPSEPSDPETSRRSPLGRLFKSWLFWMTLLLAMTGGVGGFAAAVLFKIPALPNCPAIFWPTASASLRLYCAELAANKKTEKDLLKAIALVDKLPDEHPMRQEIDRLVEAWSLEILDLAEVQFQNGEIDEAIAIARRIPRDVPAHDLVDKRIDDWREVWAEGERIFQEAEAQLQQENFKEAFAIALRLLSVGNQHWETTQYDKLNQIIETAREDGTKLTEARNLVKRGGLDNILEAIQLIEDIDEESYVYPAARRTIEDFWGTALDLGLEALDRGNADTALKVARSLPDTTEYQAKAHDLRELAYALTQASRGTVTDLEAAIIQAKKLQAERPLYSQAQQMISRWQLEIQDVQRLARAEKLAEPGGVENLRAAIAEAKLVLDTNPRAGEAQEAIARWSDQIQTIEDGPYLERARELASRGDVLSLQAGILEARRINEGSPLYDEAASLIAGWTERVERIEDQPILTESEELARVGNLPAAIARAEQIRAGRVLYNEAQANIQRWQGQITGATQLQEAVNTASTGTPSSLASAIQALEQIPPDNPSRSEAEQLMNRWSQEILQRARQAAGNNLERAIAIANLVPPRTEAYAAAQLNITTWQEQLRLQQERATMTPLPYTEEAEPLPYIEQ